MLSSTVLLPDQIPEAWKMGFDDGDEDGVTVAVKECGLPVK